MKPVLTGLFIFAAFTVIMAQSSDSLMLAGKNLISRQLENYEELAEAGIDLSELTEDLEYFLENPINLNDADKGDLKRLIFLNDIQIKNLLDYRKKYGTFLSIYELKVVEGLGRNTLEKIRPFIVLAPKAGRSFKANSLLRGKHDLIIRFQRKLVRSEAYNIPEDSLQLIKSGSFYLGDPNRYYLRYRYRVSGRMSIGLIAEKDPGEAFLYLPASLSTSIRNKIKRVPGFDHYSFHFGYETKGILNYAVLGDYHARFGQGLVLWSGLSFGGGNDPSSVKRYASGIRPNTSANENMYLRGGAISLRWKALTLDMIYSRIKADANIIYSDSAGEPDHISSLPNSGYHRSLNELEDKKSLLQERSGGHFAYTRERFQTGITVCRTNYGLSIDKGDKPPALYQFRGNNNLNAGIYFDLLLRKTNLFGEFAVSKNGGWALLAGLTHTTARGSIFGLLVREYKPQYQNYMAQAQGKRTNNANERGVKLMLEMPLFRKLSLQASFDHYSYPWLTSRTINIKRGQDHRMLLLYKPSGGTELELKYRFRSEFINNDDLHSWFDKQVQAKKHEITAEAGFTVSASCSGKVHAGYTIVKASAEACKKAGSLLLLDIYYHPERIPFRLTFRYALFHTDDYDSRLYAYEHDVLYASSMPAYYGKGFRFYIVTKYSPARWLDAWLRFSMTCYTDRNTIGSGPDEITGNKLPEIKLQLRIKL